jgi:hypothetical protein
MLCAKRAKTLVIGFQGGAYDSMIEIGDSNASFELKWGPSPRGVRGICARRISYMHIKHRIRGCRKLEDRMTEIEWETELREADPTNEAKNLQGPRSRRIRGKKIEGRG